MNSKIEYDLSQRASALIEVTRTRSFWIHDGREEMISCQGPCLQIQIWELRSEMEGRWKLDISKEEHFWACASDNWIRAGDPSYAKIHLYCSRTFGKDVSMQGILNVCLQANRTTLFHMHQLRMTLLRTDEFQATAGSLAKEMGGQFTEHDFTTMRQRVVQNAHEYPKEH